MDSGLVQIGHQTTTREHQMDTVTNPRDAPGARAGRKPQSPEQKAREALKRRLGRLGQHVELFTLEVEQRHSDRSGNNHWGWMKPPANNSDLRGPPNRPRLLDKWERVEQEAAAGCEASAGFIAEFGPMFRLALELRHHRPPPRAADYDPLEGMTDEQRRWVEQQRVY